MRSVALTVIALFPVLFSVAQSADFSIPDTICEGKPVYITNIQPQNASSWDWNFCSGNAGNLPEGVILGNPMQYLNAPNFITLVRDSLDYYSFISSSGNASIIRCYFGHALNQHPITVTNLGNTGAVPGQMRGIQVGKDGPSWYGFLCRGTALVRMDFGSSLSNNPMNSAIPLPGVATASGIALVQQGNDWIAFCTDLTKGNLIRLDFGLSLANDPQLTNLGGFGLLDFPSSLDIAKDNGIWYALVSNMNSNTLCRLAFGNSLYNTPSAEILQGIEGLNNNAGVVLISDCQRVHGFVTNSVLTGDFILHLRFDQGLGGPVVATPVSDIELLNRPYGISEFYRTGDTIYGFIANSGSSEISRIFYPVCHSASQPSYSGPDPPPVIYSEPGDYNILLTVDEGLPTQSMMCRNLIVMPKPDISLGPDRTICQNDSIVLDAGPGDSLYEWSTGAKSRTISVDTTGSYWVHVVNYWTCEAWDTVRITQIPGSYPTVDTSLCSGLAYWAQHEWRYSSGIYYDSLKTATGCDSIITTNLTINECPLLVFFPGAFTPNGDGLNDVFKPVSKYVTNYELQVFSRWGQMIFSSGEVETGWDGTIRGKPAEPDVYSFVAIFETEQYPGETKTIRGTFTLVR